MVPSLKIPMDCPIHERLEKIGNGLTMIAERLNIAIDDGPFVAVTKFINHTHLEQLPHSSVLLLRDLFDHFIRRG